MTTMPFDDSAFGGETAEAQYFLKVGAKRYAIGTIWSRIANSRKPKAEVAQGAKERSNADLHAMIRKGSIVAYGWTANGHRKDMPVLQAVLDQALGGGNWFGIFDVGNGEYYVGAIREGNQIEDAIYPRHRAVRIAEQLTGQGDWNRVILPEEFNYEGATSLSLAQAIGKIRKPCLVPLKKGKKPWLLVLLLMLLAGAGYYFLVYAPEQQRLEEEALRRSLENSIPKRAKVEIPPAPWVAAKDVPGGKLLRACSAAVDSRIATVAGWETGNIRCTKNGASMELTRQSLDKGGAPVTWIRLSLDDAGVKANVTPTKGDGAEISWSLGEKIDPIPKDVPDVAMADIKRYMLTSFEHLMIPITFGSAQGSEFFSSQGYSFSTQYDPATFAEILDLVPTATVDSFEYNPSTGFYEVAGKFHQALEVVPNAKNSKKKR